ncbi:hypothetical protein RN001_012955 [Aquatica leii]|uniref:tRNA-splicing endonuclease subunit Sen54 N-terminal domain-containing protein n=1 Tax=Aquatica leii TaxID=1421715 RepID=A0AAN7NVV0_9COLE|nr:hypothetical protein RN001_012955 [Aquatica leii]
MDEWAKTLIDTHRNPLKNVDTVAKKFFLPTNSEEETDLVNKHLDIISNALSRERVERRCARAVGHWLPKENVVHVVKVSGIVNVFGFANKTGKYLYPEEAMYLLETNRIEIFWNNVPMSIQQGYEVLVSDTQKYVQFRNFSLQGYRLKVYKNDLGEPSPKKVCVESSEGSNNEILKKLQALGPQRFQPGVCDDDAHYRVFPPEHLSQSSTDLKFYSSRDKEISSNIALMDGKTITGIDNSYFQFCSVNLPNLT